MCVQFKCPSCQLSFTNHCKDKPADAKLVDSKPGSSDTTAAASADNNDFTASDSGTLASDGDHNEPRVCPGAVLSSDPEKCETCTRIKGVIRKLEALVFQVPFLETDGLAGLEKLAAWEKDDYKDVLCGRNKEWDEKIASREARHEVQERIENMGLDGIGDERKEHQGFEESVTPMKDGEENEEKVEIVW